MTGWHDRHARLVAVSAALLLALPLAACAPEPGTDGVPAPDEIAGGGKDATSEGGAPPSPNPEALEKHTDLPPSFPSDEFAVPQGAEIDDVGESGEGGWFIVLAAGDGSTVDALWEAVIVENSLQIESDGGAADFTILTSPILRIEALRIPADGLVSYSLTRRTQ